MRTRGLVALGLAAALVTGLVAAPTDPLAADEEPSPRTPAERPPQAEIDAAVERGVAWLRKEQKRGGSFGTTPGETAIALLTLRHCGLDFDDPPCRRAAASLERSLPDGTVYGAALGVVALLAQHKLRHRSKIEELAGDVVDAQCRNGQWSYGYRSTSRRKSGDNSNTQFATLALAVARARRIPVPVEPLARCRAFLRRTQNEDGGFGYSEKERSRSYASMTAGAVMSMSFAVAAEKGLAPGDAASSRTPEIERGLAWLAEHFDPGKNTGAAVAFGSKKGKRSDNFWRHYWLWSLERGATAAGRERLGEHDWYARGARTLLDRQKKDGAWRDPEKELLATCFALLFFRRSTKQAITPSGSEVPAVTPGPR